MFTILEVLCNACKTQSTMMFRHQEKMKVFQIPAALNACFLNEDDVNPPAKNCDCQRCCVGLFCEKMTGNNFSRLSRLHYSSGVFILLILCCVPQGRVFDIGYSKKCCTHSSPDTFLVLSCFAVTFGAETISVWIFCFCFVLFFAFPVECFYCF